MKPRTLLERRLMELTKKLPKITNKQRTFARNKIYNIAFTAGKKAWCIRCGHSFTVNDLFADADYVVCPHCHHKLKREHSRKRSLHKQVNHFVIITTSEEFQVVRYFLCDLRAKKNCKTEFYEDEIFQAWICPDGRIVIIGQRKKTCPNYSCGYPWQTSGPMEIRLNWKTTYRGDYAPIDQYCISPEIIYPDVKIIDQLKRAGLRKSLHNCDIISLFACLLAFPHIETILKSRQYDLLRRVVNSNSLQVMNRVWPQIKIAIRHGYKIRKTHCWIDMLNLIEEAGGDNHNPKNILPANLEAAEIMWREKVKKIRMAREKAEREREAQYYEAQYKKLKSKFFPLEISSDSIHISVLPNVEAFVEESYAMHNCVYDNKYYAKDDSLIMSVQ